MGFTTGFVRPQPAWQIAQDTDNRFQLGGVTLTTTLIYLSLAVHERTRLKQANLLRQQSLILNNLVSPAAPASLSTARTTGQTGLAERLKERWNSELEQNVRKVYSVDWHAVREDAEERVAGIWGRVMEKSREGVEEVAKKS